MTSDGSPYARFRRALETGNELLVLGAARELPQIALDDALRICLVLRDGDPGRYERAAVRWLGRFALEARAVTIRAPLVRQAGVDLEMKLQTVGSLDAERLLLIGLRARQLHGCYRGPRAVSDDHRLEQTW